MKRAYLIIMASGLLSLIEPLHAQQIVEGVALDSLRLKRNGDNLSVEMDVDLGALDVESNRAVLLTPCLTNGEDSLKLSSIGVYGRRRYFYYVRNGLSMLSGAEERSYRASEMPAQVDYRAVVPYAEWMNGASLLLHREDFGCCNTLLAEQTGALGSYAEIVPEVPEPYVPALAYVRPTVETEKHFALSGS